MYIIPNVDIMKLLKTEYSKLWSLEVSDECKYCENTSQHYFGYEKGIYRSEIRF